MRPGARLSTSQVLVLTAVALKGYTSLALIAESVQLSPAVTQRVLNALTRRNLVTPTESGYAPLPRAVRTLAAQ